MEVCSFIKSEWIPSVKERCITIFTIMCPLNAVIMYSDKLKLWNRCSVNFLKKYFSLNRAHFRSFDIATPCMVLIIDIHRYTDKYTIVLFFSFLKKKKSERSFSIYLSYFYWLLHHFVWYFFQWVVANVCDHSLWNLGATKKYKNDRSERTSRSECHVFFNPFMHNVVKWPNIL